MVRRVLPDYMVRCMCARDKSLQQPSDAKGTMSRKSNQDVYEAVIGLVPLFPVKVMGPRPIMSLIAPNLAARL